MGYVMLTEALDDWHTHCRASDQIRTRRRDEDLDQLRRRPEMKTKEVTEAIARLSISGVWVYYWMQHIGSILA